MKIEFYSFKICEKRRTKVCDVSNVNIVCGRRQLRRKKRGTNEYENHESVDFAFNITGINVSLKL